MLAAVCAVTTPVAGPYLVLDGSGNTIMTLDSKLTCGLQTVPSCTQVQFKKQLTLCNVIGSSITVTEFKDHIPNPLLTEVVFFHAEASSGDITPENPGVGTTDIIWDGTISAHSCVNIWISMKTKPKCDGTQKDSCIGLSSSKCGGSFNYHTYTKCVWDGVCKESTTSCDLKPCPYEWSSAPSTQLLDDSLTVKWSGGSYTIGADTKTHVNVVPKESWDPNQILPRCDCTSETTSDPQCSCSDNMDNDCDTFTDCDDSDCSTTPSCISCETESWENSECGCCDGKDNDGDGLADSKDSDCAGNGPPVITYLAIEDAPITGYPDRHKITITTWDDYDATLKGIFFVSYDNAATWDTTPLDNSDLGGVYDPINENQPTGPESAPVTNTAYFNIPPKLVDNVLVDPTNILAIKMDCANTPADPFHTLDECLLGSLVCGTETTEILKTPGAPEFTTVGIILALVVVAVMYPVLKSKLGKKKN